MDSLAVTDTIVKSYADTGRAIADARFFFSIRVGENFDDYPFSWEPFRDLAGLLAVPEQAQPIVFVSQPSSPSAVAGSSPRSVFIAEPEPHCVIEVSPGSKLSAVVDAWVAQLIRQGVSAPTPVPWFLDLLKLPRSEVSPETLAFLLGTPVPETDESELSASVRKVADSQRSVDTTAWAITKAIVDDHEEYATRRLSGLDFTEPPDAIRATWDRWRDSVVAQFDRVAVAESRHQVVDGRLFIVGLCFLDASLRAFLEAHEVWVPLLLEVDESVAQPGGPLRQELETIGFAAGYQSDQASGTDQLGIEGEVNALCEVLLDSAVRPPVSVGLFGLWGSGKTFFMDKMRERIAQVTSNADPRQVRDVVQIRFNAWHYSDTSLWASLATEIFDRLADPEPVDPSERETWLQGRGDPGSQERASLLAQLETYRSAKAAIDAESEELVARRDAIEERRGAAIKRQRDAVAKADIVDVVSAVLADQQVKASLAKVKGELGIEPSLQELNTLHRELSSSSGYLLSTWQRVRGKSVAALLVVVGVVAVVVAAALIVRGAGFLGPALAVAASLAAAVTTVSGYVRPAARHVNRALEVIGSALGSAERAEAAARQHRDDALRALELELAEAESEIAQASASSAALTNQIAATEARASKLTVGSQLFDFLADRSAGYQRHMGVVGTLHRDFVFLDARIRALAAASTDAQASAPGPGGATGAAAPATDPLADLRRIDRVILYIDDLDRCPPDKVLEVLEAVHLLLAMELFVVVVGVDPRWLRRSLRYQYRHLVTKEERTSDTYLTTMPIQYLEKIFQIPLTLAPMQQAGYSQLISGLAPTTQAAMAAPEPVAPASPDDAPAAEHAAPTRSLLPVQPGSSAAGGRSLDITSEELQFAQALGPLVSSPRAAKRLMNTYRLIRSTQRLGGGSRFLGKDGKAGSYEAALLLLGIASGFPHEADRLLEVLERGPYPDIASWTEFVAALNPFPNAKGEVSGSLVPDDLRLAEGETADFEGSPAARWAQLYLALTEVRRPAPGLEDLTDYQYWGPFVARFSFQL